MENMAYDEEKDCYVCHAGNEISWVCDRKAKTATGYIRTTSIYRCDACKGCPHKTECIKGNNCNTPMEDRLKTLQVSKTMKQKRQEDLGFRRYAYRGIENVTAQSVILAIAHNVSKYHNKIQSDKTGQHLFELKDSA